MELRAFGMSVPHGQVERELAGVGIAFEQEVVDPGMLQAALYSYDMAQRLARDARPEYERHLGNFDANLMTYLTHLDHLSAVESIAAADLAYLRARLVSGSERQALFDEARQHYQQAIEATTGIILRYYLPIQVRSRVFSSGVNRYTVRDLPFEQQQQILEEAMGLINANREQFEWFDSEEESRWEYELFLHRATEHLSLIGS